MIPSRTLFFRSQAVLILIICMGSSTFAKAKKKNISKLKKTVVQKLNKQTNDELAKNEEIQACYLRSKAGREKQHGVIFLDFEVGMRSELNSVALNKGQSTLSPEVGNCIVEAMKNLIIPFKSSERNKKILVVFRF